MIKNTSRCILKLDRNIKAAQAVDIKWLEQREFTNLMIKENKPHVASHPDSISYFLKSLTHVTSIYQ